MGMRSTNALMVKSTHSPSIGAKAMLDASAYKVVVPGVGVAWVWETNISPMWARASVGDLMEEVEIFRWVLDLPPSDYRMVRVGEELGSRGDWMDHPFTADKQVMQVLNDHDSEAKALAEQ